MSELRLNITLETRGPATAILLGDEQVAELSTAKAFPVIVSIGDATARLRLARMGGENMIGLSKANRSLLGVETGDTVDVVITPDLAERTAELPAELVAALAADGVARRAFESLSLSRRKEMARSVSEAKQEATRERRLAKVVQELLAL
ncbi:YdeI/OmpD-associated family protein [Galactobacter caseinivorans]|uniref:DUF1905 domain-containing protein n=1 Tax=Galactobacter caseinivorans TaxID=2676123 RepID=A0A496PM13_9MICC|nr:YdeI/OmpD-associated family protein [Galactobacter caseinivorans]RKW71562.1 DUF1905 domain-containing protein [Galactobacter caseinivorans]